MKSLNHFNLSTFKFIFMPDVNLYLNSFDKCKQNFTNYPPQLLICVKQEAIR